MVDSKTKRECCGCGGCEQICPVHAIAMREDSEGFLYPQIDKDKCLGCNLCDQVCPFTSNYVGESANPKVYAAICKDEKVCKKSSSGGAFTAISDWILSQQGVVYGVEFDDELRVVHTAAECAADRNRFRGSKYVQSETKDTFNQVEMSLKKGRIVLFTGTPCQIEALNKYMILKKVPTENLYTIDNICHGVASPGIWMQYIQELRKQLRDGESIRYISMRSKRGEWRRQEMDVVTNQRNISKYVNEKFSWNRFFRSFVLTRLSCFDCKFTSYKRCSDLTLADYWNYENAGLSLDDTNGVSLVLVNTEKGERLFEAAKSDLQIAKSTKEACWQIHLEFPNNEPKKRQKFWHDYENMEIGKVLRKYTKGSAMNKLIRFVSPFLRKLGLYTLAAKIHHAIGRKKRYGKKVS